MLGFGEKSKERLVKMAIDLVGPDNIAEMLQGLLTKAIEHKASIPLEDGETDIIGILYEKDKTMYFALVGFNNEADHITRYIQHYSVNELANKIISK